MMGGYNVGPLVDLLDDAELAPVAAEQVSSRRLADTPSSGRLGPQPSTPRMPPTISSLLRTWQLKHTLLIFDAFHDVQDKASRLLCRPSFSAPSSLLTREQPPAPALVTGARGAPPRAFLTGPFPAHTTGQRRQRVREGCAAVLGGGRVVHVEA